MCCSTQKMPMQGLTRHKSAKRLTTKPFHVRQNIQGDVAVHVGMTVSARSNGVGGDARPREAHSLGMGQRLLAL